MLKLLGSIGFRICNVRRSGDLWHPERPCSPASAKLHPRGLPGSATPIARVHSKAKRRQDRFASAVIEAQVSRKRSGIMRCQRGYYYNWRHVDPLETGREQRCMAK
jgi:hypothetical protein